MTITAPSQETSSQPDSPALPSWVWAGNPFFIVSPLLLLYGLYRLVTDPRFLATELGQVSFNFCALELYLVLVSLTAVFLGLRKIWVDSLHLVTVLAVLLLSPFFLISQSAFLNQSLALSLSAAGGAVSLACLALLRWKIPELFRSRSLIAAGALFIAANAAVAPWYRSALDHHNEAWAGPSTFCWFILLPALASLLNWVRPFCKGPTTPPGATWLPAACVLCWTIVTGLNFWAVGYVDDRALKPHMLVPALWVLAWTAAARIPSFVFGPTPGILIRSLPAIAAALSLASPHFNLFAALNLANAAGYLWLARRKETGAQGLVLLSACCAMAAFPAEAAILFGQVLPRQLFLATAFLSAVWVILYWTPDARAGVLCGLGAAAILSLGADSSTLVAAAWQLGLVTGLLHSLKWHRLPMRGWLLCQQVFIGLWLLHSWAIAGAVPHGHALVFTAGGIVVIACGVAWFLKRPVPWTLTAAGLLAAGLQPLSVALNRLGEAPAGVVVVSFAFLLIVAGVLFALRRRHQIAE